MNEPNDKSNTQSGGAPLWLRHVLFAGIALIIVAIVWFVNELKPTLMRDFLNHTAQAMYTGLLSAYISLLGFMFTSTNILISSSNNESLRFIVASKNFPVAVADLFRCTKLLTVGAMYSLVCLLKPSCFQLLLGEVFLFAFIFLHVLKSINTTESLISTQTLDLHDKKREQIGETGGEPAEG